MALPNASQRIIQQGAFCNVVLYDAANDRSVVGLVTNCSYTEDLSVVPANVIGFLGSIANDVQNYSCMVTIGSFVPLDPRAEDPEGYLDGGNTNIQKVLKTRSQIALTGKGTAFSQVDFVDLSAGVVYNSFSQGVVTNNGTNIAPATYVTSNIQMMFIERIL